jgi:hypothetical protein
MFLRRLPLLILFLLSQASLTQQIGAARPHTVPETCPITNPSDQPFVPPPPYSPKAPKGAFWFGTDQLWTVLPTIGTWKVELPHDTPADPTVRQTLFFWRQGYYWHAEPLPHLTVTGKRLDAPAPPLMADRPSNGYREQDWKSFMVTGINLPTAVGRSPDTTKATNLRSWCGLQISFSYPRTVSKNRLHIHYPQLFAPELVQRG